MSKPILDVKITTSDDRTARVKAVLDSGSFYSIVREDVLPSGSLPIRFLTPRPFGTASKGGQLQATGEQPLIVTIGRKNIRVLTYVSPDLNKEMILGAGAMQEWDISIVNKSGRTTVNVGRDMNDPDLTEID